MSASGRTLRSAVFAATRKRLRGGLLLVAAFGALGSAAWAGERVALFAGEPPAELELVAFRVFREGARVTVLGAGGAAAGRTEPLPATRYLRGAVRGEPGSLAVVALEPDGSGRGLVVSRGERFLLERDAGRWRARRAPAAELPAGGERCASGAAAPIEPAPRSAPARSGPGEGELLAAVVAVETDWELYSLLGSSAAVASHVGDLFATVAAVYRRDLGTDLEVGDLFVWADPDDPFTVESDFLEALYELGDHWHAEHADVERALVHLVSGKGGILGGIGYHGVVCRADTPVAGHWGGGYSLTGAHAVFGPFRDAFLTAHELGHNFRAYHTHCFDDLPLPGDPEIDRCVSGETRNDGHACYLGPVSMPADGGSIMSYCHLLAGGYSNVSLSLGEEGRFGERSERVVDRMREHVQSVTCLVPADPLVFADGFESGDASRWSGSQP